MPIRRGLAPPGCDIGLVVDEGLALLLSDGHEAMQLQLDPAEARRLAATLLMLADAFDEAGGSALN